MKASSVLERLRIPRVQRSVSSPEGHSLHPLHIVYLLIIPALLLVGIGLMMSFSSQAVTLISKEANPFTAVVKPALLAVLAVAIAAAVAYIPSRFYWRGATYIWVLALFFQSLVLSPLGFAEGGNRNWIKIPGLPFLIQPSEILKVALVLVLAQWLAWPGTRINKVWPMMTFSLVLVGGSCGAIMLGSDLGTTLIVLAFGMAVIVLAGAPKRILLYMGMISSLGVAFAVALKPSRMARITAVIPWMRESTDLAKTSQTDHSLWALGSGGLFGLGPGASREKWNYLQAAHTDFILAIIGEEFGLVGVMVVCGLLLTLVVVMFRLAHQLESPFETLIVVGVACWLAFQTLVNVSTVIDLGPVIGVPLPFVSSGGTALIFTAMGLGLVISIARDHAGLTGPRLSESGNFGRDPRHIPKPRPRNA